MLFMNCMCQVVFWRVVLLTLFPMKRARRARFPGSIPSSRVSDLQTPAKKDDEVEAHTASSIWVRASSTQAASRSLQEEFKNYPNDADRIHFVEHLHKRVWQCIHCKNANHVLQLCIRYLPPARAQFVIDEISKEEHGMFRAACHRYGCRVVERLIEHCSSDQQLFIFEELLPYCGPICVHYYANHVFQMILRDTCGHSKWHIIGHKFLQAFADHLIISGSLGPSRHALPVVRTALEQSTGAEKVKICHFLLVHHADLIRYASAHRKSDILSIIQKTTGIAKV